MFNPLKGLIRANTDLVMWLGSLGAAAPPRLLFDDPLLLPLMLLGVAVDGALLKVCWGGGGNPGVRGIGACGV